MPSCCLCLVDPVPCTMLSWLRAHVAEDEATLAWIALLATVAAVLGGPGSDRLLARDGDRDRLDGGPGRDTARVDSRRDQVKSVAVLLR